MNKQIPFAIFVGLAALCFGVLIYHVIGVIQPFDKSPAWRHAIFIGVCSISVYGLLKRPEWFVWFFGLLVVQQLYSHGSHFINQLHNGKINWIDVAVIIITPIVFILLLADRKTKQ